MASTAPLGFEVLARKQDADKGCEKVVVDHPAATTPSSEKSKKVTENQLQ
jgi:hypothetical protein